MNNKSLKIMLVVLFIVGCVMCYLLLKKNKNVVSDQPLIAYEYYSGGGMEGGYHSESIKKIDNGKAYICIEKSKAWNMDPVIQEYLVEDTILDELEAIILKEGMNEWHEKVFTDEIVYDAGSESYRFVFEKDIVSFTSQIYPKNVRDKLSKLDAVIDSYVNQAVQLPSLVNDREVKKEYYFPENKIEAYVHSYKDRYLVVRILNGTEKDIELPEMCQLINMDSNEEQIVENQYYDLIYADSSEDVDIELESRLDAGNYKLILGDLEIQFEIK